MARMSREFSLVLLGAGLLTAGYFFWPENDAVAEANDETARQVTGNHHARYHTHLIIIPGRGGMYGPGQSAATVSRGGFGSIGARTSGLS